MNAKDMLALLRDMVGEGTAAHWSDVNLVRRLNVAQRRVGLKVGESPGQWLVTSASVTPVASVITLPRDCAKPLYLEETSSGGPVTWLGDVAYRRVSRAVGTSLDTVGMREAYPLMGTIEVNQDGYATACTLWYQLRVPDLHTGVAGASSAASALHMAADLNRSFVDDYYNGVTVEVVDGTSGIVDVRSVISDYTASTGVAVITGTAASGDTYGTVSRLPEETHMLVVYEAAVASFMKPSSSVDEKVMAVLISERDRLGKEVDAFLMSRIPGGDGVVIGDPY